MLNLLRAWFQPPIDWAELRAQAEAFESLVRARHDRTGRHVWIDATSVADVQPRIICRFCDAVKD